MKIRFLTLGLLLSAPWGLSSALAHETDQFSVPSGQQLADLRVYFSSRFYDNLQRAVSKTNARIASTLNDGAATAQTARLHSPDTIAWAVLYEFPPVINYIERMELSLRSSEVRSQYPGYLTVYQPALWIYSHWLLVLDPTKLVRLARCSTVMIDGVCLGTDKIAHFVHMGYLYFAEYRTALAAGCEENEATRRATSLGSGGHLLLSENALLGLLATGVRSNGDLAANFAGFKFFRNLTEPTRVRGEVRPPLLVLDGVYWRLADHVNPFSNFFSVFVSNHWNEALNPSTFGPGIASCVREGVRPRCEDILAWYVDKHGRRRTRAEFVEIAEQLRTYYGEDYGHEGAPEAMAAIAELCFPGSEHPTPQTVAEAQRATLLTHSDSAVASSISQPRDELGRSPLWWAAAEGRLKDIEKLLVERVDLGAADVDGETPLHAAARNGQSAAVKALIARGASMNATTVYGLTPLHVAARALHGDVVRILLEKNANPWRRDAFGVTALHEVAARGDCLLARQLLEFGADPSVQDNSGTTPLHRAARAGDANMVTLLLSAGADTTVINAPGHSAADEARLKGHAVVAELLAPTRMTVKRQGR